MNKFTARMSIRPSGYDEGWVLEIDGDIQSHVDLHDPSVLRFEYLRRMGNVVDMCWPPGEQLRILHVGAGALTLARYVQATRPGSAQTVIEIDPELVSWVVTELPLPEGTDLSVITGDARNELTALEPNSFDAIIVDIFTGHDTATHLTEVDFFVEALGHLTEQGVLMVNIGDDVGLAFLEQQAHMLHVAAQRVGLGGVWLLADTTMLMHRSEGNAVLVAGPILPTDERGIATFRSQLAAAGPYPATVRAPGETDTQC